MHVRDHLCWGGLTDPCRQFDCHEHRGSIKSPKWLVFMPPIYIEGWSAIWALMTTRGGCTLCVNTIWRSHLIYIHVRKYLESGWMVLVQCFAWVIDWTKWSDCKRVLLVTLGGCHFLDSLVVVPPWKHARSCVLLQRCFVWCSCILACGAEEWLYGSMAWRVLGKR